MDRNRQSSLVVPLAVLAALRLVVNTAHRLVYPFLPVIARGLRVSLPQAGLLVSLRWLGGLATPVVVTVVGRGERRRRLVVFGLALFALGAAVTAASSVWVGAAAGFLLMGVAKPVYDVAAQAYLSDRVAYERRARYLAVLELTWAGGLLLGAPAAGWMIDRAGWNGPFWAIAALSAVGALFAGRALQQDRPRSRKEVAPLRLDRSSVALLVVMALFTLAAELIFVVFGAWLEDSFGLSLLALGGTAVLVGAAELTGEGGTLAFTDRIGKRRAVAVGLVVSAVAFVLLAVLYTDLAPGLALFAVALTGFEFTIVSSIPLASEAVPDARARYLALVIVATGVSRTIGAAAGPLVFSRFGFAANAGLAAAADLAAVVLLLVYVRDAVSGGDPVAVA